MDIWVPGLVLIRGWKCGIGSRGVTYEPDLIFPCFSLPLAHQRTCNEQGAHPPSLITSELVSDLTYLISESRRQASRALPTTTRPLYTSQRISLQPNLPPPSNETRVILAIEALGNYKKLSLRAVAKLCNVPESTLCDRRAGRPARRDIPANSRNLTDLEEQTIVQYVVELYTRAFPPRLGGVEDMAIQLLRARYAPSVGKRWAHDFVKRQLQLWTCYTRRYDY